MKLKIYDFGCSRTELAQLKRELDTLSLALEARANIVTYRKEIDNIADIQWTQDNIRCEATEEVLEILNDAYSRYRVDFTLEGC